MPDSRVHNVLFLCTGNSARSIIAEAALKHVGIGRFRAFSAGSHPTGRVNPFALEYLRSSGLSVEGLRSKSWDEFGRDGAPVPDFVVTVCDNAAGEVCPVWPGQPIRAHWGVPDPAAVEGDDAVKRRAFAEAGSVLLHRVRLLASVPLATLDRAAAAKALAAIGESVPEAESQSSSGENPHRANP